MKKPSQVTNVDKANVGLSSNAPYFLYCGRYLGKKYGSGPGMFYVTCFTVGYVMGIMAVVGVYTKKAGALPFIHSEIKDKEMNSGIMGVVWKELKRMDTQKQEYLTSMHNIEGEEHYELQKPYDNRDNLLLRKFNEENDMKNKNQLIKARKHALMKSTDQIERAINESL
mmetsp:Transcript_956/g.1498  ORF Transcript_956/g.1498 Transcript_956/m.1498 type:complete len:169 (+) Transcript_956:2-508(+)